MTDSPDVTEQHRYNDAAIRTAEALSVADGEQARARGDGDIPPDKLFRLDRTGLGVAREYEAMGNRPVTDDLAGRAAAAGLDFEHLAPTVGTVVHGIDLRLVESADRVRLVRDLLLERKVIFFRDQHLSEDEQVAFGSRFGSLDAFPFGRTGTDPHVLEIRHGRNNPGTENGWHTDVTWMERPSLGSVAQLIVAPPFGGDTLFSDSHACYQGLPTDVREEIEHLDGINDYRNFVHGYRRRGLDPELVDQIKDDIPFGVSHPLVRTHPETGKRALYLNGAFLRHESLYDRRTGDRVGDDESKAIVARVLEQHARPEYQCRFRWTEGAVAFWDNRAVQHYAASDYHPHERVLRRVTVSGDRPFHAD